MPIFAAAPMWCFFFKYAGKQLWQGIIVMPESAAVGAAGSSGPDRKGTRAMTQTEIANLEHAGRSAFAWTPEGYDGKTHYTEVFAALVPAVGILAVAGTLLLAIL
jgi:hypothetical protein